MDYPHVQADNPWYNYYLTFSLFLDFTCTLTVMPALSDGDLMRVSGEPPLTFLGNNFQFMLCSVACVIKRRLHLSTEAQVSYSGALVWNSIPLDIKNSMTLNSFVQNCTFWLKGKYV